MAATKYTYSIASDTANSKVFGSTLQTEIGVSSILIAVDYIDTNGDVLDVWMKDALVAGDVTTLTAVVLAHSGEPTANKTPKVVIQEEDVDTGGSYQASGYEIDCDATTGWKETNVSFPFPISLLSAEWNNEAGFAGDEIEFLVGKDTIVGAITADVAASATTVTVDASSLSYLKLGRVLRLYDGTNQDDCGRITDITGSTVTFETATVNAFTAATPTYVQMTTELLRQSPLPGGGRVQLGGSKIGGSYIPADTVLKARYNNISGTAKKFRFVLECLY